MAPHPFSTPGTGEPPPIPRWLVHRPTVADLVVPWVTARGLGGRFMFGALDRRRQQQAILEHRCQVCGRRLAERSILLMRLVDLGRKSTTEPALDPVCAAYSAAACPMIAGRMARYRSGPPPPGYGMIASGSSARYGAPAEPWFAVWLDRYRVVTGSSELPEASYAQIRPLRIRPITWRFLLPW